MWFTHPVIATEVVTVSTGTRLHQTSSTLYQPCATTADQQIHSLTHSELLQAYDRDWQIKIMTSIGIVKQYSHLARPTANLSHGHRWWLDCFRHTVTELSTNTMFTAHACHHTCTYNHHLQLPITMPTRFRAISHHEWISRCVSRKPSSKQ